jgi:CRP/FNR family transcriptional regulator, cyclic AMP receptor protein
MPADEALLAEVPFFQFLDQQEREALAKQLDVVNVAQGELVFSYSDPGDSLFVIRKGAVEVFIRDDTGSRIVLETAGPGDMFGEISLLDGGPRTASVIVLEEMEALRLDRGDLELFLKQNPHASLDMLAAMGRRLRVTAEKLRHTASRNVNAEMEDRRTRVEKAADWIAEFSGSIPFLNLHLVLFFLWIILNVKWVEDIAWLSPITGFDPYPFGLLTMAVSLEAIVLSVFVLLSQSRQAAKDHIRSDVEYDVNLKAELEVAHLHEKVDRLTAETAARLDKLERLLTIAGGPIR